MYVKKTKSHINQHFHKSGIDSTKLKGFNRILFTQTKHDLVDKNFSF